MKNCIAVLFTFFNILLKLFTD